MLRDYSCMDPTGLEPSSYFDYIIISKINIVERVQIQLAFTDFFLKAGTEPRISFLLNMEEMNIFLT